MTFIALNDSVKLIHCMKAFERILNASSLNEAQLTASAALEIIFPKQTTKSTEEQQTSFPFMTPSGDDDGAA